jgi:KaiC/GvpD/RAD55 family RecA-like ATPase
LEGYKLDEASKVYERVASGIPGFDELVNGGFHKSTVNTVTGESGAGKTVFASQFIYHGAQQGEKGMIIMPSESAEFLKRDLYSFGWDFWKLEEEGKLDIVDVTDPVLRLQKSIETDPTDFLLNFRKLVEKKLEEEKPQRILIDDLMAFFTAVESPFVVRSLVDDLFGHLRSTGVTSVITIGTAFGMTELMEYGADSCTILNRERIGNNLVRSVHIKKMRGSRIANSIRVLDISDEGMAVSTLSPYP